MPILNEFDLTAAIARIDALWGAVPGTPAGNELDALIALVGVHQASPSFLWGIPAHPNDPEDFDVSAEGLECGKRARLIRMTREKLGLSQPDFAARFGIPVATLSEWEQARSAAPDFVVAYVRVIGAHPDLVAKAVPSPVLEPRVFAAIVHKDEGNAYGLTFPDLPGCFAAADNWAHVQRAAVEALDLWFEGVTPVVPEALDVVRARPDVQAEIAEGARVIGITFSI